jgi:glycosyltransferase involved in cell wall biosynthesis
MQAWMDPVVPLKIIGDGPLLDTIKGSSRKNISFLGQKERSEVLREMARSSVLVMPSECYEGFPMVLVEAFSQGLPVIASRLGSMTEIIEDGVTGLHFMPGDAVDLIQKIKWAHENPEEMCRMGENARKIYEEKYTPEINLRQLMDVYNGVIDEKRRMRMEQHS